MFSRVSALLSVLAFSGFTATGSAQCGDLLYTVGYDDKLRTVDPLTGMTTSRVRIVDTGPNRVATFHGLARHPTTGVTYVVSWYRDTATGRRLRGRHLCTLDPLTATTTPIGVLGNFGSGIGTWMADLAFDPNGTLYGIIGDGGADPQTLYTIDTSNARLTRVMTLTGNDGEAISFNDVTGTLYRASGTHNPARGNPSGTETFEAINVNTQTVTNIQLTGVFYEQAMELANLGGDNFLMSDVNQTLYVISSAGVVERLSTLDHFPLGMMYVPEPNSVPFFRQYGHGCLTQAGQVPWMLARGCPTGGQTLTVEVRNAVPNSAGLFAIGRGNGSFPVPTPACQLQIMPFVGTSPMTADPNGDVTFPLPVPNGIRMFNIYFQAGFVDSLNPLTVVLTNPLYVHVR